MSKQPAAAAARKAGLHGDKDTKGIVVAYARRGMYVYLGIQDLSPK